MEKTEIFGKIKYMINKKRTPDEMCKILGIDLQTLYELILKIKKSGCSYDIVDGIPVKISPDNICSTYYIKPKNKSSICFLSDLHYGSICDRPDIIKHIYELCNQKGIDTIICCGDLTDGSSYKNKDNRKNQKVHSLREMVDYVANTHPYLKGITFYTISGNHDSLFLKSDGVDVIKEISLIRPDIVYLGSDRANAMFGDVSIHIYHGYGRSHNGIIENAHRYYDTLKTLPNILTLGHVHHSFYTKFDNTFVIQNAALIDQLGVFEHAGFSCERSCFFAELKYDENGNLQIVIPELENFGKERIRISRN